jgi:aspartate/methionine/tyrosine aminotransferase
VTFSGRVPGDLTANRLSRELSGLRAAGAKLIDLTLSNPTRAGFAYPPDLLSSLSDPRGMTYGPEPLGVQGAREAIAAEYASRDVAVDPSRVVLTASTSEAYSLLFKLLCDPGDEVLIPQPSYPLFEHLARLDGVAAIPYRLEYHGRWSIDVHSVERALSSRTRALLVVNPNNPTGSYVGERDVESLVTLCQARGVAIISDEVFADYPLDPAGDRSRTPTFADRHDLLTFTLGGLSKSVGLPQLKLGWIVVSGSRADAAAAIARLELACDTYLSVSTPVQLAAGELLRRGSVVRHQIHDRVRNHYARCRALVAERPACRLLHAEGGWYSVIQVPTVMPEEELALTLLRDAHVLIHPGYFFDFPTESFVIVSLLPPTTTFVDGIARVLDRVDTGGRTR